MFGPVLHIWCCSKVCPFPLFVPSLCFFFCFVFSHPIHCLFAIVHQLFALSLFRSGSHSPLTRFLVKCGSPFMRLAEHLTELRAPCTRCLPGRRKPDVLRPGIVGMRGSIPYGLKTTALHEMSTPRPPHCKACLLTVIYSSLCTQLQYRVNSKPHTCLRFPRTPSSCSLLISGLVLCDAMRFRAVLYGGRRIGLNDDNVMPVSALANRYEILPLMNQCEGYMKVRGLTLVGYRTRTTASSTRSFRF